MANAYLTWVFSRNFLKEKLVKINELRDFKKDITVNEAIFVAAIGATGLIIGAILTFLGTAFTAKQKITELEISYRQKMDENYLSNVRSHIETLYIPININLTKLANKLYVFKSYSQPEQNKRKTRLTAEKREEKRAYLQAKEEFRRACQEYVRQISELFDKGNDIYLTTKIEEKLRSFNGLLDRLTSSDYEHIACIEYEIWKFDHNFSIRSFLHNSRTIFQIVWKGGNEIKVVHLYPLLRENETNSTFIDTREFEELVTGGIEELKSLIREVTLGAVPPR